MRVLGLAQRYGAGIPMARRALRVNEQPEPDFRVEPNWVHCTVSGAFHDFKGLVESLLQRTRAAAAGS